MKTIKISPNKTNRSFILEQYFTDISKFPILTEDEETELAHQIQETNDINAINKLVNSNLRFVISVAKQYQGQGMSLEDLIQEGNTGLHKAAEKFDPTKGFKFISYAVWWIRQSILQALSQDTRMIRLPMNQVGNLTKLYNVQNNLTQELEREPSEAELAECFKGLTKEKIGDLMTMGKPVSIDAPISIDDDSLLSEVIPDNNIDSPDANLMFESDKTELYDILKNLSERERNILLLSYGVNEDQKEYTIEELSEIFNLTKERIRQIKAEALLKARKFI